MGYITNRQLLAEIQKVELAVANLTVISNSVLGKVALVMSQQSDIDAQTTKISTDVASLDAAVTAIKAEIANLQAGGVNTAKLDAIVAQLDASVASVAAIPPPGP